MSKINDNNNKNNNECLNERRKTVNTLLPTKYTQDISLRDISQGSLFIYCAIFFLHTPGYFHSFFARSKPFSLHNTRSIHSLRQKHSFGSVILWWSHAICFLHTRVTSPHDNHETFGQNTLTLGFCEWKQLNWGQWLSSLSLGNVFISRLRRILLH